MINSLKETYPAMQRVADSIKYYFALAKIKWCEHWEDDSAGSPELISYFRGRIKDTAKQIQPVAKRLGKTIELEKRVPFM